MKIRDYAVGVVAIFTSLSALAADGIWPISTPNSGIVADQAGNIYTLSSSAQGGMLISKFDRNGELIASFSHGQGLHLKSFSLDPAGNIYAIASTQPFLGPVPGDYVTVKFSRFGNVLWERTYGAGDGLHDDPYTVQTDAAGNVLVSGASTPRTAVETRWDQTSVRTVKYDSAGNELWSQSFRDGNGHCEPTGLKFDSSGNFYLSTRCTGRSVLLKQDANGGVIWRKEGPAAQGAGSPTMLMDSAENIYLAGWCQNGSPSFDAYLEKYDSQGNHLWFRSYHYYRYDQLQGATLDKFGNVILAVRSQSPMVSETAKTANFDYATLKYDPDGTLLWAARHDGEFRLCNDTDIPSGVTTDHVGDVYVTGYSGNRKGSVDYLTIKYNRDGQMLWTARYNADPLYTATAHALSIVFDNHDGVVVSGRTPSGPNTVKYPTHLFPVHAVGNGLFYQNDCVRFENSGFFTLKVAKTAYTGKMFIDGDTISFSGKLNVNEATNKLTRAKLGKADLFLRFQLQDAGVTGTVTGDTWQADLFADYSRVNVSNPPPSAVAGAYTMLFPGTAEAVDAPKGLGFATTDVKTNGLLRLAGTAGDGSTLSQSVPLSAEGRWPLFAAMHYTTLSVTNHTNSALVRNTRVYRSSMLGWLSIDSGSPAGAVNWTKRPCSCGAYHGGTTNHIEVAGSRFIPPPKGFAAVDLSGGLVELKDGDLLAPVVGLAKMPTPTLLTMTPTNHLVKLTINGKTGLVRGTFKTSPESAAKVVKGAALQGQNTVGGLFLGSGEPGRLVIEKP